MYLADIDIYKSDKYNNSVEEQHLHLLELEQNRYLMNYWENISDLFCLKLPKKFNFLDISKFNIRLGEFSGERFERSRTGGIATYKRNDFDFEQFKTLSDIEKNSQSLDYLRNSLIDVCEMHNVDNSVVEVFHRIFDSIENEGFELTRFFSRTTKWNKSRTLRAVTVMHHKQGGIDVNIVFQNKNGCIKYSEPVLKNCYWESVYFDIWKGYWLESKFIVENKNGKVIKELMTS